MSNYKRGRKISYRWQKKSILSEQWSNCEGNRKEKVVWENTRFITRTKWALLLLFHFNSFQTELFIANFNRVTFSRINFQTYLLIEMLPLLAANCARFLMALVIFRFVSWRFNWEFCQSKFPKGMTTDDEVDEEEVEEELCFKFDVTWSTDNCLRRIFLLSPKLLTLSLDCCGVLSSIDFCLQKMFFVLHCCCCRMLDIFQAHKKLLLLLALLCIQPNIFMIFIATNFFSLFLFFFDRFFPFLLRFFTHANTFFHKSIYSPSHHSLCANLSKKFMCTLFVLFRKLPTRSMPSYRLSFIQCFFNTKFCVWFVIIYTGREGEGVDRK